MDAIAHTQVSVVCLVTLAVLLRAQQKMRDKSLPGRLFTALLWSAGALTIVEIMAVRWRSWARGRIWASP